MLELKLQAVVSSLPWVQETELGPLQEQYAPLTAEHSLQILDTFVS